jgi:hypothetical protein
MTGIRSHQEQEELGNLTLYWMKKKTLSKMKCCHKMMREMSIRNKLNRIGKLPIQPAREISVLLNKISIIKIAKSENL